jgi:hypothetical protein
MSEFEIDFEIALKVLACQYKQKGAKRPSACV